MAVCHAACRHRHSSCHPLGDLEMRHFTTLPAVLLDAAALRSRCAAAAKLAMRGTNYSPDDRADCAAKIAADALGNGRAGLRGTPRDVLRFLSWADRYPATVAAMVAEDIAAIPASAVT